MATVVRGSDKLRKRKRSQIEPSLSTKLPKTKETNDSEMSVDEELMNASLEFADADDSEMDSSANPSDADAADDEVTAAENTSEHPISGDLWADEDSDSGNEESDDSGMSSISEESSSEDEMDENEDEALPEELEAALRGPLMVTEDELRRSEEESKNKDDKKPRKKMTLWEVLTKRAQRQAEVELKVTGHRRKKIGDESAKQKNEEGTLTTAELLNAEEEEDYSSADDRTDWDLRKLMKECYPDGFEQVDLAELSDSSMDEEGPLLRTGNIPSHWYDKELHDGYDVDGNKVTLRGMGDNIDHFLLSRDRKKLKRTIYDRENDRIHELSDRELNIIKRIRHGKSAAPMFQVGLPEVEVYDITTGGILPKSQFTISKHDYKRILRYSRAIRNGWIRVDKQGRRKQPSHLKGKNEDLLRLTHDGKYEDIWDEDNSLSIRMKKHSSISAPKERRPTHDESFNPPMEYLMSDSHKEKMLKIAPENRNGRVIPIKFDCMRKVPAYDRFIHERLQRCLDLYLCPRKVRMKKIVNPKDLLPKLPKLSDLKPFPEILSMDFVGHSRSVRCLDVSPCGTWLVTGSDDSTVRIWEIETGREFWRHKFGVKSSQRKKIERFGDEAKKKHSDDEHKDGDDGDDDANDEDTFVVQSRIQSVQFNPVDGIPLLLVVIEHRCLMIPLPFLVSKEEYSSRVSKIVNRLRKKIDSTDELSVIPQLSLDETLHLFKQDIVEELEHWPELIEEMTGELNWKIPEIFTDIANKIKESKLNNNNTKTKKELSEEDAKQQRSDEESSSTLLKSKFEELDEKVLINSNDINIAARWCLLTLHSNRSNTISSKYSLLNSDVACVSALRFIDGCDWHKKGDYFATFRSESNNMSALMIHRYSKMSSQMPLSKAVGRISCVRFHPSKPWLYVGLSDTTNVLCLDLQQCRIRHRLQTTAHSLTDLSIHKDGLNVLSSGMDGRICWFDTDLSHRPYKTLKYHRKCVRSVCFHSKYPLFATAADDGKVYVFYCQMFRQIFADPVLIPLKILDINAEKKTRHRILQIKFHPTQPWLLVGSTDSLTRLYTAL